MCIYTGVDGAKAGLLVEAVEAELLLGVLLLLLGVLLLQQQQQQVKNNNRVI